jgi:hypothetical protein
MDVVMIGSTPTLLCEVCRFPMKSTGGKAVWSLASIKGHLPAVHAVCGESCEVILRGRLDVQPVRSMSWADFVQALT